MKNKIKELINESIQVKKELLGTQLEAISSLAEMMLEVIKGGNKILIFGNGGSAADSMHTSAELVGRFKKERRALPCISLTDNVSILTALSNDYSFECIFERQIEALGKEGDLALGLSTSGKSKNVICGIQKAIKMKLKTAVLIGKEDTELSRLSQVAVKVPSGNTARIQESHITIAHIVCEIVEDAV